VSGLIVLCFVIYHLLQFILEVTAPGAIETYLTSMAVKMSTTPSISRRILVNGEVRRYLRFRPLATKRASRKRRQ
jgi:hypothetical protein